MNFSILWSVIVAIEITNEMEELVNGALSDGFPCVLGTASLNGDPNLSFKGSMMVISSNELAFCSKSILKFLSEISSKEVTISLT